MSICTSTNGQAHLKKIKIKKSYDAELDRGFEFNSSRGFSFSSLGVVIFRVPCTRAINPK